MSHNLMTVRLTLMTLEEKASPSHIHLHGHKHHATPAHAASAQPAAPAHHKHKHHGLGKLIHKAEQIIHKAMPIVLSVAESVALTAVGVPPVAVPFAQTLFNGAVHGEKLGQIVRDEFKTAVASVASAVAAPYIGRLPTALQTPAASVVGAAATGQVRPSALLTSVASGEVAAGASMAANAVRTWATTAFATPAGGVTVAGNPARPGDPLPWQANGSADRAAADGASPPTARATGRIVSDTPFGPPMRAATTVGIASGATTDSTRDYFRPSVNETLGTAKEYVGWSDKGAEAVAKGLVRGTAGYGQLNFDTARPLLNPAHYDEVSGAFRNARSAEDLVGIRSGMLSDGAKTSALIDNLAPWAARAEAVAKPLGVLDAALGGVDAYGKTGSITTALATGGAEYVKAGVTGELALAGATAGFEAGLPFAAVPVVGLAIPFVTAAGGAGLALIGGSKALDAAQAQVGRMAQSAGQALDGTAWGHQALTTASSAMTAIDNSFNAGAAAVGQKLDQWAVELRK